MTRRGQLPHTFSSGRHGYPDFLEDQLGHGVIPHWPHPALLEEELDIQRVEIQRLLRENRRLAEDHIDMQRELVGLKDEMQQMDIVIADIKAEKQALLIELSEKVMKLEAELRANEPLRDEMIKLYTEFDKLNASKQDLLRQMQSICQELTMAKADSEQIPILRSNIDSFRQELISARAAFEHKKKENVELVEKEHLMERNLFFMGREIQRLRAELGHNRARSSVAGEAYEMKPSSNEGALPDIPGNAYSSYSGVVKNDSSRGSGSRSQGAYEKSHLPRP